MPSSFFISASPNDTALDDAYTAIAQCITNNHSIKQVFIFNLAATLFKQNHLAPRWIQLLERTQSDVIICSKAAANAQLDTSTLPSNATIAGMASFVESINPNTTVYSFSPTS